MADDLLYVNLFYRGLPKEKCTPCGRKHLTGFVAKGNGQSTMVYDLRNKMSLSGQPAVY